mmetsp:Transcript_15960/g.24865  ORF Transcript_15960/g.24865 Transcript_15960/m.24865 type:complete len:253 (+) Transcript_15960:229-987(+)|eukprot:CAMPEP_0184314266 /NCGR_PEP_ID=MMETSP1049-20130417/72863_1 /TAXON_ID=77928 /ORGANISM="Proteomonas sulcata, Strain CCMP704" /LENGTH=252 /DNA_ID=CAMNT_0026632095 /DNA_START=211 /DNA_END=969 /DNA_ORIENTATION=+
MLTSQLSSALGLASLVVLGSVAQIEGFAAPRVPCGMGTGVLANGNRLSLQKQPVLRTASAFPLSRLSMQATAEQTSIGRIKDPAEVYCPCGSSKSYQDCCFKFHQKNKPPKDPEDLIKSRYSAYALGLPEYIIASTAKNSEEYQYDEATWKKEIRSFMDGYDFQRGVFIDRCKYFGPNVAYVEFKARMVSEGGQEAEFIENSRIEKKGNRWYYVKGTLMEHHGLWTIRDDDSSAPIKIVLYAFIGSMIGLFL